MRHITKEEVCREFNVPPIIGIDLASGPDQTAVRKFNAGFYAHFAARYYRTKYFRKWTEGI